MGKVKQKIRQHIISAEQDGYGIAAGYKSTNGKRYESRIDFHTESIENLINSQVLQAIEKIKSNLDDLPHVNYKGGYQIPYEEIEGMIEAIEKEYRNE